MDDQLSLSLLPFPATGTCASVICLLHWSMAAPGSAPATEKHVSHYSLLQTLQDKLEVVPELPATLKPLDEAVAAISAWYPQRWDWLIGGCLDTNEIIRFLTMKLVLVFA